MSVEQPVSAEPTFEVSTADVSVEQPAIAEPTFEVSTSDVSVEQPAIAEPTFEVSTSEESAEQPVIAEPTFEVSTSEMPVEQPVSAEPTFEVSTSDVSAEQPVIAEPTFEVSASEISVEQPISAEPAFEVSASEISVEQPISAEPAFELSTSDVLFERPVSSEPITDLNVGVVSTETPVAVDLLVEASASEEPIAAEPAFEASTQEVSADQPVSDEPTFEVTADFSAEQPITPESSTSYASAEQSFSEESSPATMTTEAWTEQPVTAEPIYDASALEISHEHPASAEAPFELDQEVELSESDVVADDQQPELELTASDVVDEPSPYDQQRFEAGDAAAAQHEIPHAATDVVFDLTPAQHAPIELVASDDLVETSPAASPEPYTDGYDQPAHTSRPTELAFDPPPSDASAPQFETGTLAELAFGSAPQAGAFDVEHSMGEAEPIQLASNAEFLDAPQLTSTGEQWGSYQEQAPAWSEEPIAAEWDHSSALQQAAQYPPEHAESAWPPPQQSWEPAPGETPTWAAPAPEYAAPSPVPTLSGAIPASQSAVPFAPIAGPGAVHTSQGTPSPRVAAQMAEAAQWAPPPTPSDDLFGAPGLELSEPAGPGPTWIDGEHRVIIHTLEGQVKRGTLRDTDLLDHMVQLEQQTGFAPERIQVSRLKAVFFMLPAGSRPPGASGQKLRVTFNDGRQIAGFCSDYTPNAPGFFVIPADNRTNTARIFIYRSSVQSVIEG